jgi:hypothetical protein
MFFITSYPDGQNGGFIQRNLRQVIFSITDSIEHNLETMGNGELLELRLLETGFLSRFQNKMSRF